MQALWRAASEAAEHSACSDGSPANPAEEAVYQELEEQVHKSVHQLANACLYEFSYTELVDSSVDNENCI